MAINRRYEAACEFLRANGFRYSRQSMVVVNELFFNNRGQRHFKINEILKAVQENHNNVTISNASLTNILKRLCEKGHIKEVYVNRPYYDVVTEPHIHFYNAKKDLLFDAYDTEGHIEYIKDNLSLPKGCRLKNVQCVINLEDL